MSEHERHGAAPGEVDDLRRRAALAAAIPEADDDTPLARQAADDARRRISLRGRRLPAPSATRVVTVANQKGGVGKTTSTVNLAAALAQSGLRVLVLDVDPQGNASTALGVDHADRTPGTYEVLVEGLPLAEALRACPDVPGLQVCPASIDLAGAEMELAGEPDMVERVSLLRRAVADHLAERERAGERLDYVLVDCPPSLGLITLNALVAAAEVLIPIQCEYYALEGLTQLRENIGRVQRALNPSLEVSTILLTMYDGRTRLAREVAEEVRRAFPDKVLDTTIPRSVRISEAPSHSETVMTYDPGNSGALSYLQAAREVAERRAAAEAAAAAAQDGAQDRAQDGAGEQEAPAAPPAPTRRGRRAAATAVDLRDPARSGPDPTGAVDLRGHWTPDRRRAADHRS